MATPRLATAFELNKLVGAICLAPVVLARAGLLTGIPTSVWPSPGAEDEIRRAGGQLTGGAVACAGRLITARGPEAAGRWAEMIVRALLP